MAPRFFSTPAAFREWMERHHADEDEHWVTSAKRPETRERRLATLIEDSGAGRTVKPLTRPG